jgi:hypothetical protein
MKRKTSQVASELIKRLDTHLNDESIGNPFFPERGIQPFPLTTDGFKTIQNVDSDKKTAFVDGGNQEVLGAPNFSVQLNRVYFGMWSGNTRIPERSIPKRIEFFAATFSDFERGEIQYSTTLFPLAGDEAILPRERDLSFSSMDRSITVGNQRADIYRVGSISRRFSELVLAKSVVENELAPGDVILLDGTLQTAFPNEYAYLDELSQAAQRKGVILGGLSKASALFTDTGYSLLGALDKLSAEKGITSEWYYPIADGTSKDHFVFILGVKLNAISERIFRLEIQRDQFLSLDERELNELLTQLVRNSADYTFPGYPYGLIDADRFARVTSSEREHYFAILRSQMAAMGKWEKFYRHVKATDAHNVLNKLG